MDVVFVALAVATSFTLQVSVIEADGAQKVVTVANLTQSECQQQRDLLADRHLEGVESIRCVKAD